MRRSLVGLLLITWARSAPAVEIELSHGQEFLTHGYADWQSTSFEAAWSPASRMGLGLGMREFERFDLRDLEAGASTHLSWGQGWNLALDASASPTHRFMPAWNGALQLQRALGSGFVASSGIRWARYENNLATTSVVLGNAGIERYWGSQRLAWTGYLATVADAWSGTQRLAWDVFYGDQGRFGVGVAAGKEIESTGAGPPLVTPILSASLGGRHGIGAAWAITYELSIQRQGDLYTRTGGRVGLRCRF